MSNWLFTSALMFVFSLVSIISLIKRWKEKGEKRHFEIILDAFLSVLSLFLLILSGCIFVKEIII